MASNIKVFKFGGSSIKDVAGIKNITKILQKYKDDQILVVVSAMGKTTNAMEAILDAYVKGTGDAFDLFEKIKQHHYIIMSELFKEGDDVFAIVNDAFVEIEWVIEEEPEDGYDYLYDQIVSVGEFVSSKIISAYLERQNLANTYLDVRDAILTDNTYREGRVDWEETNRLMLKNVKPLFEQKNFIVTQGFIGGTSENFTTTLGREGSDFTGAIFSYCLDAERMAIWKDVPGILTGDPTLFDNVSKIDRLSYKEAIEMTYYGAKVLHPKTIKPLQNKSIPLNVLSFIDPEEEGTFIGADIEEQYPPVVVVEQNQILLQISTKDFSFVAEHHLSFLFKLFTEYRIKINMMQNMAISFSVCATYTVDRLLPLLEKLKNDFKVHKIENLELITIRHSKEEMLENLTKGKMILLEQRIRNTVQLVVKEVIEMERRK